MNAYPGMKFNRDLSNFSLTRLAAARLASNPAAKQIKTVTANATISRANPPSEDSIPKIGERALAKVFKPPISLPKTTATITAGMRKTNPPMTVVFMKSSWRFIALSPFSLPLGNDDTFVGSLYIFCILAPYAWFDGFSETDCHGNLTPFDTNWKKGSGTTPLTTQDF